MKRYPWIAACLSACITAATTAPLAAQDTGTPEARTLLEQCAADGEGAESKRRADEAERRFRTLVAQEGTHAEHRVGLAQVLIRCQIRHAGVTSLMALISEAERELRTVLTTEPEHWSARFTLAMLLRNMPAMLGRGADAVREFERLLIQQGRQAEHPHYSLPFLHLGDLHESAGRKGAAVEIWRRGLALFPDHAELKSRLEAAGVEPVPDEAWLTRDTAAVAPGMSDATPVFAFAPLRAEALNHQFQDARSGTTLRRLDVYTMPGGTGEMLQALQAMPGATRAGDGAELYIRGGDPAETPVFFDGGRLAFPGRWESLQGSAMGVVDAAVLRRAYFSSGGFSARYGNALSGIVDVETEGRPTVTSQRIGLSMVQAGGSVRAQTGERTGAWATLSGTDTRLIARMTGEAEVYTQSPQSVQGVGGVTFEPVPGVELRATALTVGDRFGRTLEMNGHNGEFESSSTMQHVAVSGRALRPDGQRGVSGSITASRRAGGMRFGVLDRDREDRAIGARIDTDAVLSSALRTRAGAEVQRYDALSSGTVPTSPALAPGSPSQMLPRESESAWHTGAYVEAEHAPVAGLAIVVGIRADALPGDSGVSLDPRIAAAWTSGSWTLRAGAGVFHQGSWRARYRLPDPAQPSGTPRRAEHLVGGVERAGTLSMRVEAYLKRYDDYAPAGAGPAIVAGTSTGLDAIARWSPRSGPTGWLSYSLLRGVVELENDAEVPSALDVTHSFTSVVRVPLGTGWELGATARYATGKPFTPRLPGTDAAYGPVHSERVPEYRRLDARVTRYIFGENQRMAVLYLEMLNLLDRRNVMSYTYSADGGRVPVNTVFARRTFVVGVELQRN